MPTETTSESPAQENIPAVTPLSSFDFGPAWARQSPGLTHQDYDIPDSSSAANRQQNRRRPGQRDDRPNRDRRPGPGKDGRPSSGQGRDRAGSGPGRDRQPSGQPRQDQSSNPAAQRGRNYGPRRQDETPLPRLRINFIPEQRHLAALVRQVSASRKAHTLRSLAAATLSNIENCCVKIEAVPGPDAQSLFQCGLCKVVTLDREAMVNHIVKAHFDDFFDKEEIEGEPVSGQFVCVAKCGLSGVLLGPPNHHNYTEKLQQIYHTQYSHMPLKQYTSRIEVSRDPALIEQWKTDARKQCSYKLKNQPAESATRLNWTAARLHIIDKVVPANIHETVKAILPVSAAMRVEDRGLAFVLRAASRRETQLPRTMMAALRPALRHKKLLTFRIGQDPDSEFVTASKPTRMEAENVVPAISAIVTKLQAEPRAKSQRIAELVRADGIAVTDEEITIHLNWLAEKGYVIAFADDTFCMPTKEVLALFEEKTPAPPEAVLNPEPAPQPEPTTLPEPATEQTPIAQPLDPAPVP